MVDGWSLIICQSNRFDIVCLDIQLYMCHVFNWRCVLDCAVSDCPKKCLPAQILLSNRFDI